MRTFFSSCYSRHPEILIIEGLKPHLAVPDWRPVEPSRSCNCFFRGHLHFSPAVADWKVIRTFSSCTIDEIKDFTSILENIRHQLDVSCSRCYRLAHCSCGKRLLSATIHPETSGIFQNFTTERSLGSETFPFRYSLKFGIAFWNLPQLTGSLWALQFLPVAAVVHWKLHLNVIHAENFSSYIFCEKLRITHSSCSWAVEYLPAAAHELYFSQQLLIRRRSKPLQAACEAKKPRDKISTRKCSSILSSSE